METTQDSILVSQLPTDIDERSLGKHFGSVGAIGTDRISGEPKIFIYKDRATGLPSGEATITYENPISAKTAIDKFDGSDFLGATIKVEFAQGSGPASHGGRGGHGGGSRGGRGGGSDRGGPGTRGGGYDGDRGSRDGFGNEGRVGF